MVSFFDSEKSHSLLDIDDNRTITSHSETLSEESSFLDENVQINSGKWSRIENELFIEGVIKYKCNWKRIQKNIKTRTILKCVHMHKKFSLK